MNIPKRLWLIVVAVAVPMLLLCAGIVWWLAQNQYEAARASLVYSGRSISSAVDSELGKYLVVAQALAVSPSLQKHDLVAFRDEAQRALSGLPAGWVSLADVHGQQLVNTLIPAGRLLPPVAAAIMDAEARAFATRQVQVADVVIGPVAKVPVLTVGVPVFNDAGPAYFVMLAFRVAALRDLLNSQQIPEGWIAVVVDHSGNVVARSRDHDRWVGRPAAEGLRAVMRQSGTFELQALEDQSVIVAITPSRVSGWATAVAAETSALATPIRQTLIVVGLVGLIVTTLSTLLAGWAARRITAPIEALESGADALRHRRATSVRRTGVPEVDRALDAFAVASTELKTSEERLRLFIEQAPAAIAMFDRNMCYVAASRRWLAQFHLGDQDVVGRLHYDVLAEIPADWRERHRRALAGETFVLDAVPFVRADGHTQWLVSEIRPWLAPDGMVGGIVIFSDDVTAKKRAEEDNRRIQAELSRASRLSEMGRMAAAFAHELNQPLAAVANYVSGCRRLLRGGGKNEGREGQLLEVMDKINAQALRAGDVIRGLREFIGATPRERSIEDAAKALSEASVLAFASARHSGVLVRSNVSANARVLIDKVQFQQVIINLVHNAVEAMEATPRKELELGIAKANGETIAFSVTDTGEGIAPRIADRLFRPFSTTRSNGMGIGLSVCREIVEAHGGKIWAEPNPGGGTVFRFTLPIVAEQADVTGDSSAAA